MKTIAFYHLKGGVGKTAAAVNIAWLAAKEHRTLLWDMDPQAAATWYLGHHDLSEDALKKVLKGKAGLGSLIVKNAWPNLDLIPAGIALQHLNHWVEKNGNIKVLAEWIEALSESYSLLVMDAAPSIDDLAENILRTADRIYLPLIPTYLSMNAYEKIVEYLQQIDGKTKRIRPFFSMVDRRKKLHREFLELPPIKLRKQMEGYIPYNADIEKMGDFHQPLPVFAPRSPATLAYKLMWEQMAGQLWKAG